MDDSCAVCAETLDWVAYGRCGHREVCSTCVVRLRFILDDRRCCICKIESPTVFVTKAMGGFTKVITDFSAFPLGACEGRIGEYWYYGDSQAYFDDVDHYKMIKAMCMLSCNVCDSNTNGKGCCSVSRRNMFKGITQLKGHMFHQHKLFMCTLCLEGRKVFISEQRLYTREQLKQHISTGDSKVDGSEIERGGFKGHPSCEFCKSPFYGENELYVHMSREHDTCHICQRQNPGHYDYFRNYGDLEIHFRQGHYLCENEECLALKFVVFQSESELKRHNTMKHGGHMSRSQRNAALQIPTSFRYQESNVQVPRRGRVHFQSDSPGRQLAMAIQASLQTTYLNNSVHEVTSSSFVPSVFARGGTSQTDAVAGSFESSRSQTCIRQNVRNSAPEVSFHAITERTPAVESSFGYVQDIGSSSGLSKLALDSFPPLPGVPRNVKKKSKKSGSNTFAEHIRKGHSHNKLVHISPPSPFSSKSVSSANTGFPLPSTSTAVQVKSAKKNKFVSPNQIGNPWKLDKTVNSSAHTNCGNRNSWNNLPSSSNHHISTPNANTQLNSGRRSMHMIDNVQIANNKSLVEKIRVELGMNKDRFAAFKKISGEFRHGVIGTAEYLSYVLQFELSHLTIELAQLCPDLKKQKELIDTYNANVLYQSVRENEVEASTSSQERENVSNKKKGIAVHFLDTKSSKDLVAKSMLQEEISNGKLTYDDVKKIDSTSTNEAIAIDGGDGGRTATGKQQQRKKVSKFHRVHLRDGTASDSSEFSGYRHTDYFSGNQASGLTVNGVWKKGSVHKLFS